MKELKDQVSKLIEEEEKRSMIKHPLFNSTHEGYAVIKEEVEEAEEDLNAVKQMLDAVWLNVRRNSSPNRSILAIKNCSINLAAEAIQVAAMAQKFINSFEDGEANE